MAINLYDSCPCGSGKKFKWCCQPIYEQISRAFQQDAEGQHEAALRILDQVVAEHPGNPEVWGRKAQLLYQMDRPEEAEQALDKAFELSPQYPFGHLLRGRFRYYEGELLGALLLFRKAAEVYHPEASAVLAQVYSLIADCELKLNHPLAARAALEMASRLLPQEESLRQNLEQQFGPESRLPPVARQAYSFKSPPASAGGERRAAWDKALTGATAGKLPEVVRAFQELASSDEHDAAAWYNLALCWAWLGDNARGLEALDRYVALEADEEQAAAGWALGEALRLGHGMEDQADVVEYSVTMPLRDPQIFARFLGELEHERRLVGVTVDEQQQALNGLILEKPQALIAELAAQQAPRMASHIVLIGNVVRLWHTKRDSLDKLLDEIRQRAGPALGEAFQTRGPAFYSEVPSEALAFPLDATSEENARQRMAEQVEHFFEDTWIHRPLKALSGVPAVDAVGSPTLRKKLKGVLRFLEECSALVRVPYDFGRLRRKLGLETTPAASSGPVAAANVSAMSAADLAGLNLESLEDDQLEQAYQAALKLDAADLATRFVKALVARPPRAGHLDRYSWYAQLIKQSLADGDSDAALGWLDEGEKADCEHNEGRRRNDYELRRGQVLAKKGDVDQAQEVFERLIGRAPSELRYLATAAETLLSARQGAKAKSLAEKGLTEARKQNNRDSEEHFKELLAAAQR